MKASWRCLCKTSWRRLQNVSKASWRCLEDVFARHLEGILRTSWKLLEDILKTYGEDEYIGRKTFSSRRMFAGLDKIAITNNVYLPGHYQYYYHYKYFLSNNFLSYLFMLSSFFNIFQLVPHWFFLALLFLFFCVTIDQKILICFKNNHFNCINKI